MMAFALASTIGDVGTGVAALATLGLFLVACYAGRIASRQLTGLKEQVSDARRAEGRRRVFEHLAQVFDHDFVEMESEAQRLFNERPKPVDRAAWERLWNKRKPKQKTKILVVMNFYEVVAGEYNDPRGELLDRVTADKALSYMAAEMWLRAEPVVRMLRAIFKEPLAYAEWEKLRETFIARQAANHSGRTPGEQTTYVEPSPSATATANEPAQRGLEAKGDRKEAHVRTGPEDDCPPNPCVEMPKSVLVVAILWTAVIVAAFFVYIEIAAVRHFFPMQVGGLPISAIWFGAVGGLLVSLQGIFNYNRRWRRSYDYWHYLRPVLGAIMGTVGCLIFIVLAAAASTKDVPTDATFYAVVALALGYREANFRSLLTRLVDTVIIPAETKKQQAGPSGSEATP